MGENLFDCPNTPVISSFQGQFRFLSNFWPCQIEYEGVVYPSVENAYQAAKTYDENRHQYIAITPGQAKRLAKKLPIIPGWNEMTKLCVMVWLLQKKFTNDNTLGHMLLDTGDSILIEGNTWGDVFWGVSGGVGRNFLGKILRDRRNQLKLML